MIVKKFVFIVVIGVLFSGCDADELDFDNIKVEAIRGDYAFAIGDAEYTMRELIEDMNDEELTLLEDSSTSLLYLLYEDNFSYTLEDEFVAIDDVTNEDVVDLTNPFNVGETLPVTAVGGDLLIPISQNFNNLEYDSRDDEELDSLFHESGDISVTVNSTLPGELSYQLTFQNTIDIALPNNPLVISGVVPGSDGNNATSSTSTAPINNNYKTLLPDLENNFSVDFEATLTLPDGSTFLGNEELGFTITYANQTFSIIYGKFGQDTVQVGNQQLAIDFFEDSGSGIFFGSPTITFDFLNSFGVPVGMDLSGVFGDKGDGTAQTFLEGEITEEIPVVAPATEEDNGEFVTPVQTIVEVNSSNSTLDDLLATSPTRIVFDVTGISNPFDTSVSNFLDMDNTEITADVDIEIPMEIRLEDFVQSGTLSLGGGIDISNVDSAYLRIVTVNELPFSGVLALEIQDADSNSLYTVTNNLVLTAPFINVDGFVTDPNGVSADIPLSKEGVDALAVGSHVLFTITLNTPSSLNSRDIFVKVLADYRLGIKLGVGGIVNIDVSK